MGKYENYKAKGLSGEFGKSRQKGTEYVSVIFGVVNDKGEPVVAGDAQLTYEWQGYLTEATAERTIQSLRTAGCFFPGDDISNLSGLGTKTVEIQVEDTDYGKRVAWVNEPRTSSIDDNNRLAGGEKKALAGKFRGLLLATKGGLAKSGAAKPTAKAPPAGDDPWATDAPAGEPANDAAEEPAATGTHGAPF